MNAVSVVVLLEVEVEVEVVAQPCAGAYDVTPETRVAGIRPGYLGSSADHGRGCC